MPSSFPVVSSSSRLPTASFPSSSEAAATLTSHASDTQSDHSTAPSSSTLWSSLHRSRHVPTGSLSTLAAFVDPPSSLDAEITAPRGRGRARAGTMPSRFGAPGTPVPTADELQRRAHGPSRLAQSVTLDADDVDRMATMPSMRTSYFDPFPSSSAATDSLGDVQAHSLAKTLDYLGLSDDTKPLQRDRAYTDTGVPSMQPLTPPVHEGPWNVASTRSSSTSPMSLRLPGYGRMRAGTVAAFSGTDARSRPDFDVPRSLGVAGMPSGMSPLSDTGHFPRMRSHSGSMWAARSTMPSQDECRVYIRFLSADVSTRLLLRLFEPYGSIKDIQLFPHRGAALIQFNEPMQAQQAADAGTAYIGPYLVELLESQTTPPQFEWGHTTPPALATASAHDMLDVWPTRVIQVSSLPPGTTSHALMQLFSVVGPVEHVTIQPQGAQIAFEQVEHAHKALSLDGSIALGGPWPLRVQSVPDEEIWPHRPPRAVRVGGSSSIVPSSDKGGVPLPTELVPTLSRDDQRTMLAQLHFYQGPDPDVLMLDTPVTRMYHDSIPMPPDGGRSSRRMDHAKYRELRKLLESKQLSQEEVDQAALEQMDVIVDLARNYIGNTVVQRFFEQCTEDMKTRMLGKLAPHLASIGTHKNGTWAAQKIIDCANTDEQKTLIADHLQPYVPALLLDQFGNYVVQCMLPFGFPKVDFILDAMVDRCWEIAQGRFGARSMRTCLEYASTPREQIKRVALALILRCVPMATSPNGSLLLTWLFESSQLDGIPALITPRLVPHIAQLCTHKLASGTIVRILTQTTDVASTKLILRALFDIPKAQVLEEVLLDPVHGVLLVSRALMCAALDPETQARYADAVAYIMQRNELVHVPAYRRLAEQVGLVQEPATMLPNVVKWDAETTPSYPAAMYAPSPMPGRPPMAASVAAPSGTPHAMAPDTSLPTTDSWPM